MRRASAALIVAALLVSSVGVGTASAATTTNAWQAKVGSSGANGTAKVVRYTTGVGALTLKLAKLRASTTLPVVIYKGTCSKVGTVLFKLSSIKSTSGGAISKTVSLTAAQIKLVLAATKGTGKISIRIGSGTTTKCGAFATLAVPAYVAAKVTVGLFPEDMAYLGSDLWVVTLDSLVRISTTTNRTLNVLPVAVPAGDYTGITAMASGAGSLWVLISAYAADFSALPGTLLRIDPVSGAVLATIPVAKGAEDVVGSATAMWVSSGNDGVVQRIDPATNTVAASISLPYPGAMTVATDGIWLASDFESISRIDPTTNTVTATIPTQDNITGLSVTQTAIWVTHGGTLGEANGSMSRIDPATKTTLAIIPLGIGPVDVEAVGANVWVAMSGQANVLRINATTNAIVKVAAPGVTHELLVNAAGVWAASTYLLDVEDYPNPDWLVRINY